MTKLQRLLVEMCEAAAEAWEEVAKEQEAKARLLKVDMAQEQGYASAVRESKNAQDLARRARNMATKARKNPSYAQDKASRARSYFLPRARGCVEKARQNPSNAPAVPAFERAANACEALAEAYEAAHGGGPR